MKHKYFPPLKHSPSAAAPRFHLISSRPRPTHAMPQPSQPAARFKNQLALSNVYKSLSSLEFFICIPSERASERGAHACDLAAARARPAHFQLCRPSRVNMLGGAGRRFGDYLVLDCANLLCVSGRNQFTCTNFTKLINQNFEFFT